MSGPCLSEVHRKKAKRVSEAPVSDVGDAAMRGLSLQGKRKLSGKSFLSTLQQSQQFDFHVNSTLNIIKQYMAMRLL